MRLHQLLAIEKGTKTKVKKALTEAYNHKLKPALLDGLTRTYTPKNEEGETFPPDTKRVQVNARDVVNESIAQIGELVDLVATRDYTNCVARADVVVGGTVLVKNAPVPFLLFLEKELTDFRTLTDSIPTLDPSESWTWDTNQSVYTSAPTVTNRTKKEPRVLVRAPATDKHPAQTDVINEDVIVGYWRSVKFSGALPANDLKKIRDRIDTLLAAVKIAREEANATEVQNQAGLAKKLLAYITEA